MFRVLKSSAFRNLWVGGMISTVGDMALLIALPYHVYNLTRSMLATGGTFIAQVLPRLVLGSMAGVFVDRWDRKMIACDIARAVVLLPLLIVQRPELVWLVYAVVLAESILSQFFAPAYAALLPRVVERDALVAANSLRSAGDATVRLVAPLPLVVLLDAGTYLVSALLIAAIPLRQETACPAGIAA